MIGRYGRVGNRDFSRDVICVVNINTQLLAEYIIELSINLQYSCATACIPLQNFN